MEGKKKLYVLGLPGKRSAAGEAKKNAANGNGAQSPYLVPGKGHPRSDVNRPTIAAGTLPAAIKLSRLKVS